MVRRTTLTLFACLFASSPAFAYMTLKPHDSYGTAGSGELLIEPISGWSFTPASLAEVSGEFETFYVEKAEFAFPGVTYYAVLNTTAIKGGVFSRFDPLDPVTAYLYDKFISRTLAGYDYGINRVSSANTLQHVIWCVEVEEPKTWMDGLGSLEEKFYPDAVSHNTGGIGSVRVLNLYSDASVITCKQDHLVKVIPAPGAVMLGSSGTTPVLGLLRQRIF